MTRIERSIEIDATPEEVFDTLCDPKQIPHWATIADSFPDSLEAPFTAGQTFEHGVRVAGVSLTGQWTVVEYDPPRLVSYEANAVGAGWLKMRQAVSPTATGSRVDLEIDYELPGGFLGRFLDQVYVEQRNEGEAETSLKNLKHLVEARKKSR